VLKKPLIPTSCALSRNLLDSKAFSPTDTGLVNALWLPVRRPQGIFRCTGAFGVHDRIGSGPLSSGFSADQGKSARG
jgi:hypothetical protein